MILLFIGLGLELAGATTSPLREESTEEDRAAIRKSLRISKEKFKLQNTWLKKL